MREPYIMIEKEYDWYDFYPLLFKEDRAIKINGRIYQNDRFRHCSRNNEEKIIFYDGVGNFLKKFNQTVKYGFGIFYPVRQRFDTIETDEIEEVWLMDGMSENRPVIKELETYKLVTIRSFKLTKI